MKIEYSPLSTLFKKLRGFTYFLAKKIGMREIYEYIFWSEEELSLIMNSFGLPFEIDNFWGVPRRGDRVCSGWCPCKIKCDL